VAQMLCSLPGVLAPGGRYACMVFAPHEDSMLRGTAAAYAARGWGVHGPTAGLRAHPKEVRANARSRSARLHTLEAPAAPSDTSNGDQLSLVDTGFNLALEPYLMPQTLSLRRSLPPGGAQVLLGAFAAKAAKDGARSAGVPDAAAGKSVEGGAPAAAPGGRVTLQDVKHKLAPGLRSVEFTAEDGYSSGEWDGDSGSSDSEGVQGGRDSGDEWETDTGAELDAQEEEELMFHTMTQSLRVTLSDSNGDEQSKIVSVRGNSKPSYTPAPER